MSTIATPAPSAPAAAAPAAAPASAPASAPAAAPAESPAPRLSEDERLDAAIRKARPAPGDAPAETPAEPPAEPPTETPGETPAETSSEPPPPPRVAEARRLVELAKAKEAAVKERAAALEQREKDFNAEAMRVRGVIEKAWPAFELGRDLVALQGQPVSKVLARLKAAGIELNAREIAASVLEGDPDDRPLTRGEMLRLQQEQEAARRKAEEETTTRTRQEKEAQAKAQRDRAEQAFVSMLTPTAAPVTAKVLARLGAHGRALVLEKAYAQQAARDALGLSTSRADLVPLVEEALRTDYPEWAPAAAPAAPSTPAATKPPTAISNRAAAATPPPRPLSEEERWAQFERKQGARK